jgi:hypothetical protein
VQRVKDTDDFRRQLTQPVPLPGSAWINYGATVTEHDLEADAASFLAFAGALGIAIPTPGPVPADPQDLPSTPSV